MPAQVSYPGVYVLEEASGAQAVAAASTSTALFVGMADRGPFDMPTRVLSLIEYERVFGATSKGEMADQVRQFYVNGGSEAWIMRIANGAVAARVVLRNAAGGDTLELTALDKGLAGNLIRAEIDYDTVTPERSFNLSLYRNSLRSDGTFEKTEVETHANLSMDPGAARYAPNVVNGASALLTIRDVNAAPAAIDGVSIGGVIHPAAAPAALTSINGAITNSTRAFRISIGNRPPVDAVLPVGGADGALLAAIETAIESAYLALGVAVAVTATSEAMTNVGRVLQIASANGAVAISPAPANDIAVKLMLGAASGGIELDSTAPRRPAPTGITSTVGSTAGAIGTGWLDNLRLFSAALRNSFVNFTLTDPSNPGPAHTAAIPALTGTATDALFRGTVTGMASALGSFAYVRTAMGEIAAAVAANSANRWTVRRTGLRIALSPRFGGSDTGLDSTLATTTHLVESAAGSNSAIFLIPSAGNGASNVAAYSLGRQAGAAPAGTKQTNLVTDEGSDGTRPLVNHYQTAFNTILSELDSFNLMMLPRADLQTDADRKGLWGIASALAAQRRAILLVDPDSTWTTITAAENGVAALKVGVETRNSAIFWPRLVIPDPAVTAGKTVDPSGSIAGLMARTDTRFGVWTAAAGIEATVRGIVGISKNMSDEENGVINPKALNAIRLFPSGAVAWGARTMIGSDDTGNIDDKYIPVRRTMLFIEESLYRGLKFAVFRPNAEPLWASIRLAAGSFMNGLMRQGAFASRNKLEAYYVLCDATTTTETDRNLGIVNVIVAFAPLKPAEFVVLTVKQIAGQVEI